MENLIEIEGVKYTKEDLFGLTMYIAENQANGMTRRMKLSSFEREDLLQSALTELWYTIDTRLKGKYIAWKQVYFTLNNWCLDACERQYSIIARSIHVTRHTIRNMIAVAKKQREYIEENGVFNHNSIIPESKLNYFICSVFKPQTANSSAMMPNDLAYETIYNYRNINNIIAPMQSLDITINDQEETFLSLMPAKNDKEDSKKRVIKALKNCGLSDGDLQEIIDFLNYSHNGKFSLKLNWMPIVNRIKNCKNKEALEELFYALNERVGE